MSNEALDRAIEAVGSTTALANQIGISKGAVSQWKQTGRKVPAEHCPTIERITNHSVICEDLRPDVEWQVLRMAPHVKAHSEIEAQIGP